MFALSDLHIYLTVPFVLSWSLFNAMACGTIVLASATGPVEEIIRHDETGLLTEFFDTDQWVARVHEVLNAPGDFRRLGENGMQLIREKYSLNACLPQMLSLYERTVERSQTT